MTDMNAPGQIPMNGASDPAYVVSSAFAFHFVCVRFGLQSAPTHHNHSLAPGPIFGDRLTTAVGPSPTEKSYDASIEVAASLQETRTNVINGRNPKFMASSSEWQQKISEWEREPDNLQGQ